MKQRLFVSGSFALILLIGILYQENYQLHEQIEEQDVALDDLRAKQELKEVQLLFSEQTGDDDSEFDYHSFTRSLDLALELEKDSDGQFKKEWGLFLGEIAQKKEIDPYIVYELLRTETGGTFDPELVGPETRYGRAYGMAQFMKNTAPWIAEMADLEYEDELLHDPLYSIQLSLEYLNFLYDQYDDWDYTLTAYHRGIHGLEAYIEANGDAKSWYAEEIQENASKMNSDG